MIGCAHSAGTREGARPDLVAMADYFSIPADCLARLAEKVESSEDALVVLLQNSNPEAKVRAATLYSSAWSKAYTRFGHPYGKVHRDFHYQAMFTALAALVEVGCDKLRIDHPAIGTPWSRDAYICLLEVWRNLSRNLNPGVAIHLQEGTYDPRMPRAIDEHGEFHLQDHRPVSISPFIHEGFNFRKVFVEKAVTAIQGS